MKILHTKKSLASLSRAWHRAGETVALVPTMGCLHAGHLSLVALARKKARRVVVSLFVNPTQFGPNEDFARYPRTEKEDLKLLRQAGADAVFLPTPEEMYGPEGSSTVSLSESRLSTVMCGACRPGHFAGVMQVCLKLFHVAMPDIAVFGEKDAQQLAVLRRMVRDLDVPVKLVGAPLVRESDGLALSSRNRYLSAADRERALSLSRALADAEAAWRAGETRPAPVLAKIRRAILRAADSLDYAVAVDKDTLEPVRAFGPGTLVAVAARFGSTRLIDNHIFR